MDTAWLFAPRYFNQIALNFDLAKISDLQHKKERIAAWQKSIQNRTILQDSEIQLQTDFLKLFFEDVLGYTGKVGQDAWNLDSEFAIKDGKRADGYLGYFSPDEKDIRIVIELKDAKTDLDRKQNRKDSQTPVEQAFSYAHKIGTSCKWVILSNFREIRLYPAGDSNRYESFEILKLNEEENLKRFLFLLHKERLILREGESYTERHYRQRQEQEQSISKEFYNQFKSLRGELFEHLRTHNSHVDEFSLFSKAQKILDRVIFVFFCEDTGMLPYKITRKVLDAGNQSFSVSNENLWIQLKGLFESIDKGNSSHRINKFNGGLFASDSVLDSLIIKDSILEEVLSLEKYDFESDLNVNILGHIFEQSISDIEEIKSIIAGEVPDKKKGKRKKDGIFYTPEYITRYMVKEAVGGWLEDRKQELGVETLPDLSEKDFKSIKRLQSGPRKGTIERNKKVQEHYNFWRNYKEKLANIKVVDPACGSGAFLVQVFDFLYKEGQYVNNELARLSLGLYDTFDLDKHILSNNIYGVDLNEESVEISKLSLWLKTANKQSELTALDDNILCGNSLIDDSKVAEEKAFKWEDKFKGIFSNGGFDVVLGNPPYVSSKGENFETHSKKYLEEKYVTAEYQIDTYILFIEKGIQIIKDSDYLVFIIPNSWMNNLFLSKIREFILKNSKVLQVTIMPLNAFEQATVDTVILVLQKNQKGENINIRKCDGLSFKDLHLIPQIQFLENENYYFDIHNSPTVKAIIEKFEFDSVKMIDLCEITRGINPYDKYRGQTPDIISSRAYHADYKKDETFVPLIVGKSLTNWVVNWRGDEWISYGDWLAAPRDPKFFTGERILVRQIPGKDRLVCSYIDANFVIDQSVFIGLPKSDFIDVKYPLSILSSRLMIFYFRNKFSEFDDVFPKLKIGHFRALPIKKLLPESQKEYSNRASKIIELKRVYLDKKRAFQNLIRSELQIDKLSRKLFQWQKLSFTQFVKELKKSKINLSLKQKAEWMEYFEEEKAKVQAIQTEIDSREQEIDQLVYELYGLTEEEIAIVEESVK